MKTLVRQLGLGLFFSTTLAWAQTPSDTPAPSTNEWSVSTAPARFVLEPDEPDSTPSVSSVTLYPPNINWATAPIRIFTEDGVAVGSDLLWSAPGEPATVIFDSSSGAKH